jgi:hypothetical protein
MPHIGDTRYAVVSAHVERPLDDRVWERFAHLREQVPFRIAALIRPPAEGEDEERWLERAREAATRGPFGLHTHWTSPTHARPTAGDPAARVRREVEWLRSRGLAPRFFAGGGWYMDEKLAETLAELGLVDTTATAFRPGYLEPGAPRLALAEPALLAVAGGRLLEIPVTHSLGMLVRAVVGPLPAVVHAYFHDTELIDRRRAAALRFALAVLARRCRVSDLDEVSRLEWPEAQAFGR